MKPILCIVKIIRLPIGWRTFLKHYDAHCRAYGPRAKTLPNGRETLLCISKPLTRAQIISE